MRRFLVLGLLLCSVCAPSHAQPSVPFQGLQLQSWGGQQYTVTALRPGTDHLRLYWKNPETQRPFLRLSSLREYLKGRGVATLFATNSGIYTPRYAPLGLHVEGGQTLVKLNNARNTESGGGNFALRPNGVFWLKGKQAGITETDKYAQQNIQPEYATQSGPLLVQGGRLHPAFNKGSQSRKIRSGVGVCSDGTVRFVLSGSLVNFYEFAQFFLDGLHCPDALYLDGTISALYTPRLSTVQLVNFAGIWAVTDK